MSASESHDSIPISRRTFHRGTLAAAAGLALGALARSSHAEPVVGEKSKPSKPPLPAGRFVDVHSHMQPKWSPRGALTADMKLRWMDQHDVAQAVVLSLVSPEASPCPITSGWVLEATKKHRDRLIPFCDVDPRGPFGKGRKGFRAMLRRYVDAGARGLGEHKSAGPIDDPRRMELFAAAAELGLPITLHMDNIRNTDRPGLPGLERVLKAVPSGVFLGHAPGWWNALANGTIDRLMNAYPNIHGDLSAGSGYRAISRDAKFGRAFVIRRADRLCFGTDHLAPGQKIPQFAFFDKLDLPKDVEAKVFRDNARRILKLV